MTKITCFLGGRFDRFKSNEKKENGDLSMEEGEVDKNGDENEGQENN